ncbi:DsbA family protein [Meridianimarinicoccus sp. MJW13]|uniref:DsbA family protein n=1 Tax=Meridianimarinicoccus sp. MJW13 TaxID=2720031 RepID=UPI0018683383|nr:DsbA family protein [Fluviibacterium sp. MJW13]
MHRRDFLATGLVSVAALTAGLGLAGPAFAEIAEIEDMVMGDPDAPVTVIEYASFTCPHCANFHATTFKELKKNYIDTGKVRFIHREVFFDRYGLWAAMVARCGGQLRYFGVADLIYTDQQSWTQGEPAQIADNLRRIGRTSGLSNDQLDACLQDAEKAQALVAWNDANTKADGISGTPSFVIEGELYSNMSYADFAALLDEKLAAK